jgi:hypothetical protein
MPPQPTATCLIGPRDGCATVLTGGPLPGLQHDHQTDGPAALLEVLGEHVAQLDRAVRWQAVQSCRVLLGESMEAPGCRRTRRR